jgi:gliding motility-associated-like protein
MRRFLITLSFLISYCFGQIPCNNWLHIPNYNTLDYISIGDLDITGDKITIEALFAADTNYFIPSTVSYDLISKHTGPADCNYLLRPVTAEITTTNGFYQIIACDYKPKKINHAALVYDGTTLKFYRNGFLMGSKPASGNLITNNLVTKIGNYAFGSLNGSLKGYMNEVRIWNTARTQDEIKAFMNNPLLNPTGLPGLIAYYQFNDLNNKQGNPSWNGTLNGAATITNTIPFCDFIADSCSILSQPQTCSGSFGNPIVNITFGSGATNPGPQLPVAVPGASTNYNFASYATGTPPTAPIDGDYALVNVVPLNSAWYSGAKDHTGNVNGYMAFFNSAPKPGDFYRQTVNNLCSGTTYEFSAWVANVINPSVLPGAVLPNITFKILDAITLAELATYNTGNIPNANSMTWRQYSFLFTAPAGNNSVTLVLANNNIGGNAQPGNDLAIDDITFRPCGPLITGSFSSGSQVDSIGSGSCNSINLFGNITGTFNTPSHQWQISNDGGSSFNNISGASNLNATVSNLAAGQYIIRLLSAEAGNINNSNCSFISNLLQLSIINCTSTPGIKGIINYYTPVIAFNPCDNKITVEDGTGFKVGDTILMIQMKGAVIDSSNTAAFGTITDYKNAGNYEFNYVKTVTGNIVELKNVLLRQYDIPFGRVQMIRVPFYKNVTVTDTLTCLPWDGTKGGVLAFNVQDTVSLNADIDVSGKGFRGGQEKNTNTSAVNCGENNFHYPLSSILAAAKGEGIAELSNLKLAGKGKLANGGGGGNDHNAGGGGGSNANSGGNGGNEFNLCTGGAALNGGIAGFTLTNYTTLNKIYLGGGGGSGHANDPSPQQFTSGGGNGGGLVIIASDFIDFDNKKIISNGTNGTVCPGANCNDGAGGGGAGGAVLLDVNNYLNQVNIETKGGNGANTGPMPTFITGPGGGGSGGVIWFKQNTNPSLATLNLFGGINGVNTTVANNPWGALPGSNGITYNDLTLPITSVLFQPNIDSVKIKDSFTSCRTYSFNGIAFTNRAAIQTWDWNFGDNNFASSQNTTHTYATTGDFDVKLIVTDINGCKDSVIKRVTVTNCTDTILNSYAAVLSIDICNNTATIDDITNFNVGDTIVIMQMKGASIDSTNSSNFGIITSYNNAGSYEFNYIKTIAGNTIVFSNTFLNKYEADVGRVQLIRVPYFSSFTANSTVSCPAWDGTKGGVVIINSATDITLNAPIDVSAKGFRGGAVGGGFSCNNISSWAAPAGTGGSKGEGIADYIPGFEAGGAMLTNGGGGAYAANSGGGGGGNVGPGGYGGAHSNTCPAGTQSMLGASLNPPPGNNRLFFGGGGGGGQQDDNQPVSAGGNGGGIVIIKALTVNSNNQYIYANGESLQNVLVRDEGGAGGGAGGSVMLYVNGYSGNLSIEVQGGDGTSNYNVIYPTRCHGPGGGGGGGLIAYSVNALPTFVNSVLNGGMAGTIQNPASACFGTAYNATNGNVGSAFSLFPFTNFPEATVPFVKNIDSVKIKDSLTACKSFDFKGIAYIHNYPVQKWEWDFGDGVTETQQNPSHTYSTYGSNKVKLVITDINGCQDSTTKLVTTSGINFDFVFEQDVCNPQLVHFRAVGDTTAEIYWSKGDGTIITDIRNPTHFYAAPGSYLVEYCTGNATTGCIDTIKKTIFIGLDNDNIVLTPDTTICIGTSKLLRSNIDSALSFCWSPVNYLNSPNFANPITNTTSTITYSLNAVNEQNNLVVNGNFENGNTGFTSEYIASATPLSPATYLVSTSSLGAGTNTSNCNDHTSAAGNMLIARANLNTKQKIWKQQVAVIPNTTYSFNAWIQSLIVPNNIRLQLSINNNVVVDDIQMTSSACNWNKYTVLWNSGEITTADLAIIYKPVTPAIGGYFAIDDISFSEYAIKYDTVKITVDTPFVNTRTDTTICESTSVQLTTTGAVNYSWTPATGLSGTTIQNPFASPAITTKYFVTGINSFGCIASDSVTIFVNPKPIITSTGDTTVCNGATTTLFATGGVGYSWTPSSLLSNPNIANPVTNPALTNNKYIVTITGANNCLSKDSFIVSVKPLPVFSISESKSVCLNTNVQLKASGGNYYEWTPANLVSNPAISNPIALTENTTLYTALIKDTTCNYDTTLTTTVTILPTPIITASKTNDVSCANRSSQLEATGAEQYSWAPATSLNNPVSPSPVATPGTTTTYTVTGTNSNGCSNTSAITIVADFSDRSLFLLPNAFSPNGDGINDCFGLKNFGQVIQLQFLIYNRYGELVFATSNPNDCWDGTYKGKPCNPGGFVYYIKAKTTCGNPEKKGNLILVR